VDIGNAENNYVETNTCNIYSIIEGRIITLANPQQYKARQS